MCNTNFGSFANTFNAKSIPVTLDKEPENKNGYKIVDETSDDKEYSSTTE